MNSLIVITGENRCGKDTLYRNRTCLNEYYTNIPEIIKSMSLQNHVRMAFADRLKEILGVSSNLYDSDSGLPRETLINTAENIKNQRGEGYFAEYLVERILECRVPDVIITDLRFDIEYNTLKKYFPHIILIALGSNPGGFPIDGILYRKPTNESSESI